MIFIRNVFIFFARHQWKTSLFILSCLFCAPVVICKIPPLTDFVTHAATYDIWQRIRINADYAKMFVENPLWAPNRLVPFFCLVAAPWFQPLMALKVLLVIIVAAHVASVFCLAREFDKPLWCASLASTFVWGGVFWWGMVNYLAIPPLLHAAVVLVKRYSERGRWIPLASAIAVITLFAWLCNGIGFVFVLAASLGTLLVWSRSWIMVVVGFSSSIPASSVWVMTLSRTREGLHRTLAPSAVFDKKFWYHSQSALSRFTNLAHEGFDVTLRALDTWFLMAALGAVLLALSEGTIRNEKLDNQAYLFSGRLGRELRGRFLLLTSLACFAASFILPVSINTVLLGVRVVPLALTFLVLSPIRTFKELHVVSRAAVVTSAVAFALATNDIVLETHRWNRDEATPMRRAIAAVPQGVRADCINTRWVQERIVRWPLLWACTSLLHLDRQALSLGGFAEDGINIISFRPGAERMFHQQVRPDDVARGLRSSRMRFWRALVTRDVELPVWDYALLREARGSDHGPIWRAYTRRRDLP